MQQTKNRMPNGYLAMWIAISLAYLIWMVFFMKDIVLVNYATVAERTVDGVLHANISGMLGHEWLYPVWVVLSTVCLLMFIFYIKDILYAPQLTKAIKAFCLVGIIFGCVYVTWYGFFGDQPFIEKVKTITASMIGLDFPWHFRGWGVFASMTIFTNTMFAYRRYDYNSKLGVILGSIGSAAIFVTINCPSMGEEMHLDSPPLHGSLGGCTHLRILLRCSDGYPAFQQGEERERRVPCCLHHLLRHTCYHARAAHNRRQECDNREYSDAGGVYPALPAEFHKYI